jgi:hypothetical protein
MLDEQTSVGAAGRSAQGHKRTFRLSFLIGSTIKPE